MKDKNKQKGLLIFLGIALVTIIVVLIALFCMKANISTEEPILEPQKVDIEEVENYLKDNWDNFNIDGSTSMIPLHQALSDKFSSKNEEVKHSKTVDAFEKFIVGDNDILLGVTYSDELLTKAKEKGVDLVSKPITREGFVFLINKDNPIKSLTVEEIRDIYSGKITNWKDLGGDDERIIAYQRNDDSGSQMRMKKFMGDDVLMDKIYVAEGMGELVLAIAGFDNTYGDTKYAIGYNMYTFIEKQYYNEDVTLLKVDGVLPDDDSIFDETYPLVVYNYIYFNNNDELSSEFANNLYLYLMSDRGQKLISEAGYVNLNEKLERNKDISIGFEFEEYEYMSFYNKEAKEFYNIDDKGNLVVFKNYPDFVLDGSKYKGVQKARDFLQVLFNNGIVSSNILVDDKEGTISLSYYWFDASLDADDFFNIRYGELYYSNLLYYIEEDKIVLENEHVDFIEDYVKEGYLDNFPIDKIARTRMEIPFEELGEIYLRKLEYNWETSFDDIEYIQIEP